MTAMLELCNAVDCCGSTDPAISLFQTSCVECGLRVSLHSLSYLLGMYRVQYMRIKIVILPVSRNNRIESRVFEERGSKFEVQRIFWREITLYYGTI